VIDRFDADVGIARRGEEFKLMVLHGADYRPGWPRVLTPVRFQSFLPQFTARHAQPSIGAQEVPLR
jgi:hypothetical protein